LYRRKVPATQIAPLDDGVVRDLQHAFLAHQLLCYRTEALPALKFARGARYFGTPQLQLLRQRRQSEAPEVSVPARTYARPEDRPDDLTEPRLSGRHANAPPVAEPAKAVMLRHWQLPSRHGETKFANMRRTYDDLSQEMQRLPEGKTAVHAHDTPWVPAHAARLTAEAAAETSGVTHPATRRPA